MADEKITKRQKQAAVQQAWRLLIVAHNESEDTDPAFADAADALVEAFPEYLGK